jgi:hypothetical protein
LFGIRTAAISPQKSPVFREFCRLAANGGKVELNIELIFV